MGFTRLRDLEASSAVFDTASVSETARLLGVGQPAVSRMIGRIEAELGVELFHRQGGRLIPTRAGETLRGEVKRVVGHIDGLRQLCDNLGQRPIGSVSFGCGQGLIPNLVPRSVRVLSHAHPAIRVTVEPRPNRVLVEMVASRQLDLALLFLPVEHPGVAVEPLDWIASVCAVPIAHPLAVHPALQPADLAGEPLILLAKSDPARFPIEHAFLQARIVPKVQFETPSVTLAVRLAGEGCGIVIVNGLMAREAASEAVALIPFRPEIRRQLALIRPASHADTAEAAAMAGVLRALLREAGDG